MPAILQTLLRYTCALSLPVASAAAQVPPLVTLKPVDVKFKDTFANPYYARELGDGRVVILDPRDQRLVVGNPLTGRVDEVKTAGLSMATLFGVGKDSSIMVETRMNQWSMIDGVNPIEKIPMSTQGVGISHNNIVAGADTLGFVLLWGGTVRDSEVVIRLFRSTGRADTIAKLGNRNPASGRGVGAASPNSQPRLPQSDLTIMMTDGWVAVVRLYPYHVEWRSPDGRWTIGPSLPVNPAPSDNASTPTMLNQTVAGNWLLRATGEGKLLVPRAPVAAHPGVMYDLINRAGVLEAQILLPVDQHILAGGAHSLYVVVKKGNVEYEVERHPWP